MYGGNGYGELAYSEQDHVAVDSNAAFDAFLALVTAKRTWLLEIAPLSLASSDALSGAFSGGAFDDLGFDDAAAGAVTGGVETLRYSSDGYASKSGDSPAYTWYDGRITAGPAVQRRIAGRNGLGGLTRVFAEIALDNTDGSLDLLARNYALDGRAATILLGRPTDARSAFGTVFKGVIDKVTIALNRFTFSLSDGVSRLAVRVNANTYAGSGALEGGTDLKGKPKPKCYGQVFNVQPPLVDSAKLIWQVHDGQASDVAAVRDRGVAITKGADYTDATDLNTNAPAAGTYRTLKSSSGSYFRLGSTPAGTVTSDVLGDAPASGGYVDKTGDIVLRLLGLTSLTSSDIEPTSFAKLNADVASSVGIWRGAAIATVDEMVDELLAGVGAFGGFTRYGAFQVGQIAAASGTEKDTYTESEILTIEREPLPEPAEPAVWRTFIGWQKNYTVQNDVASGATAAVRTFAAEPIRYAKSEDSSITTRHLLAKELTVDANFALEADAQTEAARVAGLWNGNRAAFRVRVRPRALSRDLGQVVLLQHRRHGLSDGVPGRIIEHGMNGTTVELVVLT